MTRSLLLLLTGVLAGGVLALLYTGMAEDATPERATQELAGEPITGSANESVAATTPGFESERLAIYEEAAQTTSRDDLESTIAVVAAEPRSKMREMKLEALLTRLAELDPERAALLGNSLELEPRLLAPVYQAWATFDLSAALIGMSEVQPPAHQQTFALALLDGLGHDPENVALVAAALPHHARFGFQFEALLARAATDPSGALATALASRDSRARQLLIPALAAALTEADPAAALEQGNLIADEFQRQTYTRAVFETWAEHSPDTLFDYLESSRPAEILAEYSIVSALARGAPERMLEFADSLPDSMRYDVQFAALGVLADRDALMALNRLRSIGGQNQPALAAAIARAYGEQYPAAAADWAWSLSPPSQAVRENTLQGIAAVDYEQAVDLLLLELEQNPRGFGLPGTGITSLVTAPQADPERLLDRLLEADSGTSTNQMVARITSIWGQTDPDAAMAWALAKGQALDPALMSELVRDLARQNPGAASLALAQLPPEQREGWIAGMASSLAQTDPDSAIAFLEQHRGQPGYDAGYGEVLTFIGRSDPARAARLLADSGAAVPFETSLSIAGSWSLMDPAAATSWLVSLSNEQVRSAAIGGMVMAQASERGPDAARRWLLDFPTGPLRDNGLNVALGMSVTEGAIDTRLLEAYSSDIARQQGVGRAALLIGRRNQDEARRLLETYVADRDLRLELEEILSQPGGPNIDPRAILSGEPIR